MSKQFYHDRLSTASPPNRHVYQAEYLESCSHLRRHRLVHLRPIYPFGCAANDPPIGSYEIRPHHICVHSLQSVDFYGERCLEHLTQDWLAPMCLLLSVSV